VPITDIRLEAVSLPADAHAGFAADAGHVVAEGNVDFGDTAVLADGLKKFTPAETSHHTSSRSSSRAPLSSILSGVSDTVTKKGDTR
jgi:hypothetical protein